MAGLFAGLFVMPKYSRLEQSSVRDNGSFPFLCFSDTNIMIPPSNVKLGEVLCLCQPVDYICSQGEWLLVLNGDLIKPAIVLNEPEFSILFLNDENW